ncbi:MAG: hypothetical protein E6Q67_08910 [Roseateles sp.]|nr:MAG: hypothetical protein E6Q67_08910 [Roseateles sp.]
MLKRRSALVFLSTLPALATVGCSDPKGPARSAINTAWHRRDLTDGLLTPWLTHAPRPDGSFQLAFERHWQPRSNAEQTLAGQARFIHALALGHEATQDARMLELARRGADQLLARFRDTEHGGFFAVLGPDGQPPRTPLKRAEDHALATLALAELYRVGRDERFREAALQAWRQGGARLRDPLGGLADEASREFQPRPGPRTLQPLLHMFEALQVLHAVSGADDVRDAARGLGDFVSYKLLQGLPETSGGGARLPEAFDEAWVARPDKAAGGYFDLGHQFECAHLLARGVAVSPVYAQVSERVLAYALAEGYDEVDGGCLDRAFPDPGLKPDPAKGWWQQAECLHALVVAAQASGRADLWRRYEQTLDLIRNELVDDEAGGWRAADALPCQASSCRDEQPEPWHMVRLHHTALRLAGALPAPGGASAAASAA